MVGVDEVGSREPLSARPRSDHGSDMVALGAIRREGVAGASIAVL